MLHVMSGEDSEEDRARERKQKLYDHVSSPDVEPSRAMRTLRRELPWKDWFVMDFLRYWYWLGVMFLEVVVLSFAYTYHVRDLLGILALAAISIGVLYLGYQGYVLIWPKGAYTTVEEQRKNFRRLRRPPREFE